MGQTQTICGASSLPKPFAHSAGIALRGVLHTDEAEQAETYMTPAVTNTVDPFADDLDIANILRLIWRGKLWIVLCAFLAATLAFYYATRVAVPMYPATVTLALDRQQQPVLGDIESIFSGGDLTPFTINTEFEILRSRDVVGRLVDEMNLIEDPEFNPYLREPGGIARLRMSLTDWVPGDPPPDERLRSRVIDTMINRIQTNSIRLSLAFTVRITTTDSERSAELANALAEIYIDRQISRKLDDAQRAILFLSQRTTELEASVEDLELDLARRVERSSVIDSQLLQAQNLQLRDLRTRIEDAGVRLATDTSLRSAIQAADDLEALVTRLEVSRDTRFSGIIQRYRAGRLSEDATLLALQGVGDDMEDDIARTQSQLATLEASAEALASQLAVQANELIEITQLEREVEASQLLYQTFLTRLQEASIQQGLESADTTIISEAVPRGASSPRVLFLIVMCFVLGALTGTAIVLLREWRFAGFRTSDEVRQHTGVSVFGSLPAMAVRGRKQVLKLLKSNPNSVFAEAVRNLRTSILMLNPDAEPKVILVTSSIPGEGKTTISISLARYLGSLEGRRVLLLEADIRRQTLRAYVDDTTPRGVKLLDVLLGKATLDGTDLMDPDLGVEVLMGSGGDINAADLFESRRFGDLITRLRETYDHIVIDSPPVLAVPDARVLSRYADATIFAVRWGHTSRTQVRQGLGMLESVGHAASGTVLTQVDQRKMKSYGYAGQYGYEGNSSGYYTQD